MREKYYFSKEHYNKIEAPTLKGTKLNMAIKDINRFYKVGIQFSVKENLVSKP